MLEQGAGVLQGAGVIQCDPGFVTKDVQQKVKSSPLQTPQGVTSVEQGAGVLQGGTVENEIQCDPESFETKNGTKCDDENKVQDVQEKDEQKCKNNNCAGEIQCEQDINVVRILNVVQDNHSVKHANGEIQSAKNCDHCSRIKMEVQGMQIDKMSRVQCSVISM